MNQRNQFFNNETQRYIITGALFGLTFPVIATLIRVGYAGLPYNLASVLDIADNKRGGINDPKQGIS